MSLILSSNPQGMVGTIAGIDPGTNNLGFALIQFNLETEQILSVSATSFKSDHMLDTDSFISVTHNERIAKIFAQRDNLIQQLNFYQPMVVACENPFINRLRPAAYGPLVEILFAIRNAVIAYNPAVKFITLEPSVVKKAVGAGGIAGKEAVKFAIINNNELNPCALTDLSNLDEHAIDAIAVAYTFLLRRRKEKGYV